MVFSELFVFPLSISFHHGSPWCLCWWGETMSLSCSL
jgi:hypothetical protein